MRSSCRCCRWLGGWKRRWPALPSLRRSWPGLSAQARRRTTLRCRSRRGTSPSAPAATSRRAGAVPASRALKANPDRVVDAMLDACPHCAAAFPAGQQTPQQVYDRIELPPVRPDVTRVRLFGGRCACCGGRATAVAPCGLQPGSPFGQSVTALVVYLHPAQATGLERLAALMGGLFGLAVSEGAISTMLARAREPLLAAAATVGAYVAASAVVCSDEISARVSGKT